MARCCHHPLPHSDHVVVNIRTGDVRITGPATKEEKARFEMLANAKADFQADLDELEQHTFNIETGTFDPGESLNGGAGTHRSC
jgi:hypothetical protein